MLAYIWHWLVTSQYTRALEDEVSRLRAENRALVNSILGVAGVPPLKIESLASHPVMTGRALLASRSRGPASVKFGHNEAPSFRADQTGIPHGNSHPNSAGGASTFSGADDAASVGPAGAVPLGPIRRRSWQQIGRLREMEDKKQ